MISDHLSIEGGGSVITWTGHYKPGIKLYHMWIPNSDLGERERALKALGRTVEDLFSDVPKEIMLRRPLEVGFGRPLSEYEAQELLDKILSRNIVFKNPPPFVGGGICASYVPAVVRFLTLRGEIYTAYTPYQPEINQGVLQALFEYQSLMAELYGVEVVNASMYDGSTAVAEAFRLALRATKRIKILVPRTMNPFHRSVASTWITPAGGVLEDYSVDQRGQPDIEDLVKKLDRNTAAVYLENPSFLGAVVEKPWEVGGVARSRGALFIVYSEPTSLAIFKPPGDYGADIVVGDGQSLGLGLNYGGPGLGILGIRMDQELLRQLPGRLVGATVDSEGRLSYTLILQTREQHIRRERATSNITTNSALMAIASAIYIAYMGWRGLRRLAESVLKRTEYAVKAVEERLRGAVETPLKPRIFYREVPLRFLRRSYGHVHEELLKRGIHGGLWLRGLLTGFDDCSLYCFTEIHSKGDIDNLIKALAEVA